MFFGCTFQQRAIIGRISYTGTQTGDIKVLATRPGESGLKSFYAIVMRSPGTYDIHVRNGTYTVSAFVDTDYDNRQSANEPSGYYDSNGDGKADELTVRGEVTGIDFTLKDQ